jgi:thiamine biosynthesis lipoprotein
VIPPQLYGFLQRAKEDHRLTEGTFDITVGALVRLYRSGKVDAESLARARAATGSTHIELSFNGTARLARPGMRLDPGGIGKGLAVQRIAEYLRKRGVKRAFIDFGGSSFYGLGAPPGRRGWPVLLRSAEPERFLGTLLLKDAGMSTSMALPPPDPPTSLARGHIVDPRTGRLIEEARFAACVSPSALDAEVATKPLIVEPGLRALIGRRYPGSMSLTHTAGAPPVMDEALRKIFVPAPDPGHGASMR